MKKTILLIGFTIILLGCSSESKTHSTNYGGSNNADHKEMGSYNTDRKSPMTTSMDKMMREMHTIELTGNNEIDFAAMMIEHHKAAVEMSRVEVAEGNNPKMKKFALKVIDEQNNEIEFMRAFISKASKTPSSNAAAFQKALNHSMMAMMGEKPSIYTNIDQDFATLMIHHHQSAVDMAKAYLKFGQDSSLRKLCETIVSSQTREINFLEEWLSTNK